MTTARLVATAALVTLGATILTASGNIQGSPDPNDPGAAMLPRLVAILLILLAVIHLFQSSERARTLGRESAARVGGSLLLVVVYVFALTRFGFLASTPVFLAALQFLLSERRWTMLVGVPVTITVLVHVMFVELLQVRLPRGVLEGLL